MDKARELFAFRTGRPSGKVLADEGIGDWRCEFTTDPCADCRWKNNIDLRKWLVIYRIDARKPAPLLAILASPPRYWVSGEEPSNCKAFRGAYRRKSPKSGTSSSRYFHPTYCSFPQTDGNRLAAYCMGESALDNSTQARSLRHDQRDATSTTLWL